MRPLLLPGLLCTVLLCAAGCGVQPGDFVVYRVGVESMSISASCYTEDDPQPLEEALSSSTALTPLTYVVYYGAGDQVILDAAGTSVGGEETSDGFTFVADVIDVDYAGVDNLEAKITVANNIQITMEVDGDAVKGERLETQVTTCDFLTATPSPDLCEVVSDCTRRSFFFGVELDDVELSAVVNRPNP